MSHAIPPAVREALRPSTARPPRRRWDRWLEAASGSGWPARLAWRLGHQRRLDVVRHRVDVPGGLPGGALRVAFASDFHAGPATHPRLLDRACRALADLDADVLLLGGDFVSYDPDDAAALVPRLAEVPARLGRYAVLGNHDLWAGSARLGRSLERHGIELLANASRELRPGVHLVALDDPTGGAPDAAAALAGTGDGVRLVLMHSPDGLLHLGEAPFTVALCGHTHGGQIALPGGRPVLGGEGKLGKRYPAGRFDVGGGRDLIVSRGVGYMALPFRAWAPSDVLDVTVA